MIFLIRTGVNVSRANGLKRKKNKVAHMYAAAPSPKEKLTVEGAGHAESYVVDPQTYWHTVFTFADRFLGEDAGEARKEK